MKNASVMAVFLASTLVTGCAFENNSKLLTPTAPGGGAGVAGSTTSTGSASSSSTSSSSNTPASAFSGEWGSSSIAGLPISNCADLKWLITEQSATSLAGTVSATCAGGAKVNANLTGTINSANAMNLTAVGTIVASGIPCEFNLSGEGTRQANDSMKLDVKGSYCLGTVGGTEILRRFPKVP
jgi:hypothetical protein